MVPIDVYTHYKDFLLLMGWINGLERLYALTRFYNPYLSRFNFGIFSYEISPLAGGPWGTAKASCSIVYKKINKITLCSDPLHLKLLCRATVQQV
jgi:hypothetical protein